MTALLNPKEQLVYTITLALLQAHLESGKLITSDEIKSQVERASAVAEGPIDTDAVVRQLETNIAVVVRKGNDLTNSEGHVDWLTPAAHAEIDWRFWARYRRWLINSVGLPESVVDGLDDSTDRVLRQLESPDRDGPWDRRGMVVGHVQSGKTSHYTGLICKAVDAGYRFIVVLAGSENNLRSQTQLRLDYGFTGFSFGHGTAQQTGISVGVGLDPESGALPAFSLTSVDDDFGIAKANQLGVAPGGDTPILLVVKKNAHILKNLIKWTKQMLATEDEGLWRIDAPSILVIDDECDSFSVNTRRTRWDYEREGVLQDPTTINGRIRELLHMFQKSAFVGYTATPFANIFIYHDPKKGNYFEREKFGPDLFPQSFIVSLDRNSNYVGPDRLFGLENAELQGVQGKLGLPIIRHSDDVELWIDPKHKKTWEPDGPIPHSLREAILAFILACAGRAARGQVNVHNSMLIHLSRFVEVQTKIFHLVEAELNTIRRSIRQHTTADPRPVVGELRDLWERDFRRTTDAFVDPNLPTVKWDAIEPLLDPTISRIQVKSINGESTDVLDYERNKSEGVSVIAIGGQKLQRGLTLEGLSVSYFQRSSKMYDTLMQMGRWFGYRDGYLDLCRLYTTSELDEWYQHIATATEELYTQFDMMAALGKTPTEFGLRVATHPTLLVTSAARLRNGERLRLSFAGDQQSCRALRLADCAENHELISSTVQSLGSEFAWSDEHQAFVATNVDSKVVLEIASGFRLDDESVVGKNLKQIHSFIKVCNQLGQLTRWTIAVPSLKSGESFNLGHLVVNPATRGPDPVGDRWMIKALFDPKHEAIGLAAEHIAEVKSEHHPKQPSGQHYREKRPVEEGLLVIYPLVTPTSWQEQGAGPLVPTLGFSLPPGNANTPTIEYVVNNPYWSSADEEDVE